MIRNALASRLTVMASLALSAAGLTAFDAAAQQGKVTLNGGNGNNCTYSSITIAPNGDLNVACSSVVGGTPSCTVSGPSSATANSAFTLTANCSNGPITSYAWTGTGAPSGTGGNVSLPAGTYTYTVQAQNAAGLGAVSPGHTVTVAAPVVVTAAPSCTFSSSPAQPVAGTAATISLTCTQSPNAFAWYQYEGPTLSIPNQTTTSSQSVTFPSAGTYSWYLQAGNDQFGGGPVFTASVKVVASGGNTGNGNCPVVTDVVGPLSSDSLFNLRFDLRPGQTGTQEFTLPMNGYNAAKISGTPATSSETPKTTLGEVWVSDCPGYKPENLNPGCYMELWGNTGQGNFTVGDSIWSSCPMTGKKYLNIKHRTCIPSGLNGVTYCSHYLKISAQ